MRVVALVACVSKKLPEGTHPAHALYISDWFKKASAYASLRFGSYWILSAKHGLLNPFTAIEPYNQTLATASVAKRKAWAKVVRPQLDAQFGDDVHYVVFAGVAYRKYLFSPESGLSYEVPLEGLGIGDQKGWLKRHLLDEFGATA